MSLTIALCNEVLRDMPLPAQCDLAAGLGYDGLELAPFTLGPAPHELSDAERRVVRQAAESAGLDIVSLHWLLVTPEGLSITSEDVDVRTRTVGVMYRLIDLCAELGGKVLVHGSPHQRKLWPGQEAEGRKRAMDCFAAAARQAERAGVTYCVEALAPAESNFINSIAEAAEIVDEIASPALKTMLDCCAAGQAETDTLDELIDRWLPSGHIAHIQVNDRNKRGPGQGEDTFGPLLAALRRHDYAGAVAVEPFDYHPDGPGSAALAIGYLRGVEETLS